MGNLKVVEDELEFPKPEVMEDWLRRRRQEADVSREGLWLPLPEPPEARQEAPQKPSEPVVIDMA